MKTRRDGVGGYAAVHIITHFFFCLVLILGRAEGLRNGAEK